MFTMVSDRRIGRPPKGPRKEIYVAPPVDLAERVTAAADSLGLDVSDFVTLVLAERLGEPVPAYVKPRKNPGQLALAG